VLEIILTKKHTAPQMEPVAPAKVRQNTGTAAMMARQDRGSEANGKRRVTPSICMCLGDEH